MTDTEEDHEQARANREARRSLRSGGERVSKGRQRSDDEES